MNTNKKKIWLMLFFSILISIFTSVSVVWRMEGKDVIPMSIKNTFVFAIEFGAILVLTIAIGGIGFEKFECDTKSYKFTLYLFTILRALFYDCLAWLVDGINEPLMIFMNYLSNSLYGLALLSMIYSYVSYLVSVLQTNERFLKNYLLILKICYCIYTVVLLLNIKFRFVFSINNGYYERKFVANILFGMVGLLLLLLLHLLYDEKIDRMTKIGIYVFSFLPFACTFLQAIFNGIVFIPVGIFVSACVLYVQTHILQKQLLQEQQIEIERQKSSIMLSQIQPHFLYNTLTTISFLCRTNPENAEILTNRFSNYLRSNIVFLSTTDKIDFKTELDNVNNYLEIEKMRFEDRVKVKYDVTVDDFKIPMLTVQPIVENAVKHGICKKEDGGTIEISTYDDIYNHYVEISDDGVGFDQNDYKNDGKIHIGIENVKKRVEAIGGEILVESVPGVGTKAIIRIPKEK